MTMGLISGSAYIFRREGTTWTQVAKLTPSDGAPYDYFGYSVSLSGDYALIGAYWDNDNGSNSGSAYIFRHQGTTWTQEARLTASDGDRDDYFGYSVSLSGDCALIGTSGDDDNGTDAGSAYIFRREGTAWTQEAKLTASDGAVEEYFGYSVFLSGDYALIGACVDDDNGPSSGSAYIFRREGTTWTEEAKVTASDGAAGDVFGVSVSLAGDYSLIGAYGDDHDGTDAGSAYIFHREGTTWTEEAKITASDGVAGDFFGRSASLSSDYALIGAYGDDDNGTDAGSAYIFRREGTTWTQEAKLTSSDGAASDYFGHSVSLSGDYALIGAYYDDDNGTDAGSAYVYSGILFPNAVALIRPEDGALVTADSVTLVWDTGGSEVDRYWVEGATDSLFSMQFIDSTVTDTQYTVNPIHHNQTYWWKVRAHNSYGWGPFSVVRSFFVYQEVPAPPVLLSPDSGATGVSTEPALSWNGSAGAEFYTLQVSETPNFSTLIVNEESLSETFFDVNELSNNATYYWRTSAVNDLGASDWSEIWSFTTVLTDVSGEEGVPATIELSQNYPNPLNPSTLIRYGLPQRSHVKLELFNPLGQRVAILVDAEKEAGYHYAVLESRGLASGLYFYRFQAGNFVETKKLVILR